VNVDGELTAGDPVWDRPAFECTSPAGGDYLYESFTLINTLGREATVTIDVDAESTGGGTLYDPMLFVYEGDLFPVDSLDCFAFNDDRYVGSRDPEITGLVVGDGFSYVLVVTSFYESTDLDCCGSYTLVVTTE
jgi:hypothetical protein